ncbi:hypothetical protein DJ568_09420 [Mucilaginibacter hurinus]|uniref:Aromatic hydrocarbon degradation protein n=1 Tax=Mucilaginibacter hurinus TaxID=2201324 RepID=A0A367GMJ3_9SPHI|nr:hypothetical protein [Mucilaginibacter hurinus]RCH54702.1 hypothetical protein DJ568_09420 [Mucilaginibacter hurinus]
MTKKIILVLLCFCGLKSFAQDTHYWSADYSPAGFIVPGAVITNNRDSGVVFYNPALLAFTNKNSANISGNLYQLQSIRIKNGAGPGRHLTSNNAGIVPQMVSGTMRFKGSKPFTIGYALIQDHLINYQASQQFDGRIDALLNVYSPGDEFFLGQYSLQNKVNSTSGMLSGGFKLSPRLALGFTAEGRVHTQFYSSDKSLRAIINDGRNSPFPPFVNVQEFYQAKVTHAGLRFKTGLSYDLNRHHFGLMLTTPLLKLYGRGSILSDNALNNLAVFSEDGSQPVDTLNLLVNARQTKLKANWKMPFSAAVGYSYDFKKGQLYFAGEYFNSVADYNILLSNRDLVARPATEVNSFITGEFFKLKDARTSVFNFGMGVSYEIKQDVTGYLSARLDKSYSDDNAFKDDLGFVSHLSSWDNIHWQVGANLKRRRFNLRAGLLFTHGYTNGYEQPINFSTPNEGNFLEGNLQNTTGRTMGVKLLLAYMHNF